ncbi:MAG: hypothetical protein ACYSOS_03230, partial [Planctomycetota bacterium]
EMLLGEKTLEGILKNAEWENDEEANKRVCRCNIDDDRYALHFEHTSGIGYGNIRFLQYYP